MKLQTLGRHVLIEYYDCDHDILASHVLIEKYIDNDLYKKAEKIWRKHNV